MRTTTRAALLFFALTLIAIYPISASPSTVAFFSHPDAQLNMWIMAWDAHPWRHGLTGFLDANIFWPERGAFAYSESLLGYLPIFGPVLWLGGSLPLAFNLVLIVSFVASGVGMYLLTCELTGRRWPAVVAGIVYAFAPYRLAHIPQIQLEAMEWLPLAFLSLHRFVATGSRRYAAALAACVVMQALCCVYYAVFLATSLVVTMVVLATIDARARAPRTLLTLAIAASAVALVLSPLVFAYVHVHRATGLARSLEDAAERSADAQAYFSSVAHAHLAVMDQSPFIPRDYLFPGVMTLALATLGFITASPRRTAVYVAVILFSFAVSLGPAVDGGPSVYRAMYAVVPLFHGLRQISRFGVVTLFGLSVLVAYGAATAERCLSGRAGAVAKVLIVAVAFAELLAAPLKRDRIGGDALVPVPRTPPPEYRWLAQQTGDFAVIELPLPIGARLWQNAPYVFWSTVHGHPLVNGYSGFASPGYQNWLTAMFRFPDRASEAMLQANRVRYVVVHWDLFTPFDRPIDRAKLDHASWLRQAVTFGDTDIFQVDTADGVVTHAAVR
jgi:hypothetical protein